MSIDELIADGTIFAGATSRPAHRDEFIKCYETYGIRGLEKKYLSSRVYIKNLIYYSMPVELRRLMKKGLR
jgi:hypothetical protein